MPYHLYIIISFPQMLQTGLAECLRLCKSMGLTSMALPTIGCGKMGYPPAELANCIRYAAKLHPDVNVSKTLHSLTQLSIL
jgi:O-acetyl-ADP-ribose deacetylase (regulator of RNase III)